MFNWIIQVSVALSSFTPLAQSTASQLPSLPPQPLQTQVECRNSQWEEENLSLVQGVKIENKLAPYIQKLLADAQTTGYNFVITSGYRNCELQKELRGSACGADSYNLYKKPANLCNPPTEPAGDSLHNEALAVDFACAGYQIFAYSPCYTWLQKEAYKYQLINRPLEPWHWSTTGK